MPPVAIDNPILNSPFKTVVMAMLMAWQALNKRSDPHAEQFASGRSGSVDRRAAVPSGQVRAPARLTA